MEEKPGSVRRWFRKWEIADAFLSLVERGWQAYVLVSTVFAFVAARLLQVTGMIPQWWPAALIIAGTALFLGASLALIFSRSLIGLERRIADRYTESSAGSERSVSRATGTAEPAPAKLRDVEAERDQAQMQVSELQARMSELDAVLGEERAQSERERGDKEALRKESSHFQFALRDCKDDLKKARWKLTYDEEIPVIPDLPLHEQWTARERTQELQPALGRAAELCELLLVNLFAEMRTRDAATGLHWLADFMEGEVLQREKVARQLLNNAFSSTEDIDIRHPTTVPL